MRCLFVNWKDGTQSQYTVPADYTLRQRTLGRRPLPQTLQVFDDQAHTELLLDITAIKSCYLLTLGADQRVIETAG